MGDISGEMGWGRDSSQYCAFQCWATGAFVLPLGPLNTPVALKENTLHLVEQTGPHALILSS